MFRAFCENFIGLRSELFEISCAQTKTETKHILLVVVIFRIITRIYSLVAAPIFDSF